MLLGATCSAAYRTGAFTILDASLPGVFRQPGTGVPFRTCKLRLVTGLQGGYTAFLLACDHRRLPFLVPATASRVPHLRLVGLGSLPACRSPPEPAARGSACALPAVLPATVDLPPLPPFYRPTALPAPTTEPACRFWAPAVSCLEKKYLQHSFLVTFYHLLPFLQCSGSFTGVWMHMFSAATCLMGAEQGPVSTIHLMQVV